MSVFEQSKRMNVQSSVDFSTAVRLSAEEAALNVRELLCEGFRSPGSPDLKGDPHDLVTKYDRLAEESIRATILNAFPESRVVGEEGGSRGGGDLTWHVDPIDGTSNFAGGVPFFCVSIGVEYHGSLIAAVVFDPLRQDLFSADLAGAYRNGVTMKSSGAGRDRDAVLATDYPDPRQRGFDTNGRPETEIFGELTHAFRTVRRLGSGALTLAYVAAGQLDATLGVNAKSWDVAGGIMLVRAAGGQFHPASLPALPAAPAWACEAYVATVQELDINTSILNTVLGGLHA
ncbi:inositol monophosphatase family protein [Pseudarthrobacter sp. NPDC092439]|uniref:inositol monophosphatase family protein n=1 Tax=unclassified Pseudarthrobacter TaxID=2647000 RepID=UPI0037FC9B77